MTPFAPTALERAFEIARSGLVSSVGELRLLLASEGFIASQIDVAVEQADARCTSWGAGNHRRIDGQRGDDREATNGEDRPGQHVTPRE